MREELPVFEPTTVNRRSLAWPFVILDNPKYAHNVGNAVRALASFCGAGTVLYSGDRFAKEIGKRLPREERMREYQSIALIQTERPFDLLPAGTIPVALEIMEGTIPLVYFAHRSAMAYVFGPEDGSIRKAWRGLCHDFVQIPSLHCINLASAVNIVLYDRTTKAVLQ